MVNYYAGSPAALPVLGRQISGYPPDSGSRSTLTRTPPFRLFLVASSLLPHLARCIACPVGCPCFRFAGSWIVSLAMDGAKSRVAGADSFYLVLLVAARLKLWPILMVCWCQTFVIKPDDISKVLLRHLASKPWPLPMNMKVSPHHLASKPWPIPMTRLTTSQGRMITLYLDKWTMQIDIRAEDIPTCR